MSDPADFLELYDYRRRVIALYGERNAALTGGADPEEVARRFRATRDVLFATHPQSALEESQRARFHGLQYFPFDAAASVEAEIEPDVQYQRLEMGTSAEDAMPMQRVGKVRFHFAGQEAELSLYWIDVYGGGLFLPFRDATAPAETYGGGRYLFDTVKGSDFLYADGAPGRRIVLDFNYAYNPSCAYDSRWACPLAPRENHLPFAVRAGEKVFVPE